MTAITPEYAIVATPTGADRHPVFEVAVDDRLGENRPGRLAAVLELLRRN